ncbi:MAG: phosphatidylglycerophosphatase A [Bdellovibrionales bacterium]
MELSLPMQPWIRFTATFGYLGQSPWAPGTVGTLGAIPLTLGLMLLGSHTYVIFTCYFVCFLFFVAQAFENASDQHDVRRLLSMRSLDFFW